jgi:hypothetical protein
MVMVDGRRRSAGAGKSMRFDSPCRASPAGSLRQSVSLRSAILDCARMNSWGAVGHLGEDVCATLERLPHTTINHQLHRQFRASDPSPPHAEQEQFKTCVFFSPVITKRSAPPCRLAITLRHSVLFRDPSPAAFCFFLRREKRGVKIFSVIPRRHRGRWSLTEKETHLSVVSAWLGMGCRRVAAARCRTVPPLEKVAARIFHEFSTIAR